MELFGSTDVEGENRESRAIINRYHNLNAEKRRGSQVGLRPGSAPVTSPITTNRNGAAKGTGTQSASGFGASVIKTDHHAEAEFITTAPGKLAKQESWVGAVIPPTANKVRQYL